jgi:glycosyltransferase involved in cell wall biosynthesis
MGVNGAIGGSGTLKVLWFINVDYRYGMNHGGNLRSFNLSKELVARGHQVHYVVRANRLDERARCYLDDLKRERIVTGWFEIEHSCPALPRRLGGCLVHPRAVNGLLGRYQQAAKDQACGIIEREGIDLCIFSDRAMLFILPEVQRRVTTIVDWVDSSVLYRVREARVCFKGGHIILACNSVRNLVKAFLQERYYSRLSSVNLLVSPVDKHCLDIVDGVPWKNRVLLNGVATNGSGPSSAKIPKRIIFSGNMDFRPNYEAAIWFIDEVLPLIVARDPDVHLVVAGANPVPELVRRAGEHVLVTGFVTDMRGEIARSALYVAPMISGGGFKNKVAEALTAGTYVVATSIAVEFLAPHLREQLLVADTAREMADRVLDFLGRPSAYADRLNTLRAVIEDEFQWESRAEDLLRIAQDARTVSH